MQRVTTEKQRNMVSSEKHLLHINSAPIGEEPREEYHAGFVSWAVTKTSTAMPSESRKRGGHELTQIHKRSYCSLKEQERGNQLTNAGPTNARTIKEQESEVINQRRTHMCSQYKGAGKRGHYLTQDSQVLVL